MAQAFVLDRAISRLVNQILSQAAAKGGKEGESRKRSEQEIKKLLERDYTSLLRATFGRHEVKDLVRMASAIWPDFNRNPMGPPSVKRFSEVSQDLRLAFSFAPYHERGGFAVRGFYVKSVASLGKPLIYVNSAHHLLAAGTAFCHEVGHHLTADLFQSRSASAQAPRMFFGAGYLAHMDDPMEMAADIMVSLAGYPKPIARLIFRPKAGKSEQIYSSGAHEGRVSETVLKYLSARYNFDFGSVLPPTRKLHYLAGLIHYARLREALLATYDL